MSISSITAAANSVGGELGEATGVGVGEGLRALRGLVEEPVGAGIALAVDEW